MRSRMELLADLDIRPTDIQGLSDEQTYRKARIQWMKLSVQLHPDKNPDPNAQAKFIQVNEAYQALKKSLQNQTDYKDDIEAYFTQEDIEIPDTAFNLLMLEEIEKAYADLLKAYAELKSANEKTAFAAHYASFFNLAKSLAKKADHLNRERATHLYDQENETFASEFRREWRQLVIRLYAEEYLDDFQYRWATTQGELYSILATRKLLSPVKLAAAAIESLALLVYTAYNHAIGALMKSIMNDFIQLYHNHHGVGTRARIINAYVFLIKMLTLIYVLTVLPYLAPTLTNYLFASPALIKLLDCIASPVNNIIRPLSNYIGTSPLILSALSAAAITSACYSLGAASLMTATVVMNYLLLPIVLYNIVGMCQLIMNVYNKEPAAGIFLGIYFGGSILISPSAAPTVEYNVVEMSGLFLSNLSCASILYYANRALKDPQAAMIKSIENLPLPKEPVPENIQQATLLGSKRAIQSHRFFNTPPNAEYIETKDRTFLQQASSFFGGGEVRRATKPTFTSATPLALRIA